MKKLALVLGGGAAKGFAHIGVLQVLEENGIKPDIIVGTSMGAMIGGVYASGVCLDKLIYMASNFDSKNISDFNILNIFRKGHVMSGKKLKNFVYGILKDTTHEQLKIPFTAVATELETGKQINLKSGLVWKNVLASSSVPAVFPMVDVDGKMLCDGGIKNNVPIDVAKKQLPSAIVLAVDVIGNYEKQVETGKLKIVSQILNMSTLYMTDISKSKKSKADIKLTITQPEIKQMDFNSKSAILAIRNGKNAMERNIKKLKELLEI